MMVKLARISADVIFHTMLLRTVSITLDLANGGILVGHGNRRGGLVRLSGRPVHRHHPQVTFVLVVRSVHYIVALAYSVEKVPTEYTRFIIANCV